MSGLVPDGLVAQVAGRPADTGPDGDAWLAALPGLLDELLAEMTLTPDGPAMHGHCAVVVPVRRRRGDPAVLKVTWPHAEASTEHLALRAWGGRGAVRLLAAEPARYAMLLERLDATHPLTDADLLDACETVGALHRLLDRPPLPRVDGLRAYCARVHERLATSPPPMPRRLVEHGLALTRDLPADDVEGRLLHTDLHDGNVLRAADPDREGTVDGWVAIDPKAMNAQMEFAMAPLLWNRWDVAARAHSLRTHLRLRLDVACEAAGADEERARAWMVVRELDNAWWAARDGGSGARDRVTKAVSIIKAMQG